MKPTKGKGKLVKPAGVEFELTDFEMADLVFSSKELKIREMEISHWQGEIEKAKKRIAQRVKADPVKKIVDWGHAFETGKIYVLKNRALKIKLGKEEKRPNGKPKLQKK